MQYNFLHRIPQNTISLEFALLKTFYSTQQHHRMDINFFRIVGLIFSKKNAEIQDQWKEANLLCPRATSSSAEIMTRSQRNNIFTTKLAIKQHFQDKFANHFSGILQAKQSSNEGKKCDGLFFCFSALIDNFSKGQRPGMCSHSYGKPSVLRLTVSY